MFCVEGLGESLMNEYEAQSETVVHLNHGIGSMGFKREDEVSNR